MRSSIAELYEEVRRCPTPSSALEWLAPARPDPMRGSGAGGDLRSSRPLFLRLGTTAFGGPAAHIAMLEEEVVRRRQWVSRQRFLDLLGATNLIPGPNSTEMAIHIGFDRAGWPGLLVAGGCFIVPAALITLALAWAYVQFGALPQAARVLYGVRPVIVAVVVQALWSLGRTALRGPLLTVLAVLTASGRVSRRERARPAVRRRGGRRRRPPRPRPPKRESQAVSALALGTLPAAAEPIDRGVRARFRSSCSFSRWAPSSSEAATFSWHSSTPTSWIGGTGSRSRSSSTPWPPARSRPARSSRRRRSSATSSAACRALWSPPSGSSCPPSSSSPRAARSFRSSGASGGRSLPRRGQRRLVRPHPRRRLATDAVFSRGRDDDPHRPRELRPARALPSELPVAHSSGCARWPGSVRDESVRT